MKRIFAFMAVAILCGLCSESAFAMCGGGGWKSSSSKPAAESIRVEPQPVNVTYHRESSAMVSSSFSKRFDAAQRDMNLSSAQREEISDAKAKIQRRLDMLQDDQRRAQDKLDRCRGKCSKERRRLQEANDRLSRFNAKSEFDRELQSILGREQWRSYETSAGERYRDAR